MEFCFRKLQKAEYSFFLVLIENVQQMLLIQLKLNLDHSSQCYLAQTTRNSSNSRIHLTSLMVHRSQATV